MTAPADPAAAARALGPVQLLVVGFEHGRFDGSILAELHRLRDSDVIRVLDLLLVSKRDDGTLESRQATDLDPGEAAELGALAGALVGVRGRTRAWPRARTRHGHESADGGTPRLARAMSGSNSRSSSNRASSALLAIIMISELR